jgi:hypothetical protein
VTETVTLVSPMTDATQASSEMMVSEDFPLESINAIVKL